MMTKTVSLIVATRWRTSELRKFLDSLVIQTYKQFNVIVVDQNDDDRVNRFCRSTNRVFDNSCTLQRFWQSGGK